MSSNSSDQLSTDASFDAIKYKFELFIGSMSLAIIILGLVGNTACFLIFRFNKEMRKMSTNVYLSYCSITEVISLFVWNLDHFLYPLINSDVEQASLFACRFLSFIQYHSLQTSAWLLSFASIDRFVSVISLPGSFTARLPFSTTKSAHVWSLLILVSFVFVDFYVLLYNGFVSPPVYSNVTQQVNDLNGTLVKETHAVITQGFKVHCYFYYPEMTIHNTWERLHLFAYSFVPSLVMLTFNTMLIIKVLKSRKKIHAQKSSQVKEIIEANKNLNGKNRQTLSLLLITISFIIMAMPSSILFGFVHVEPLSFQHSLYKLADVFAFLNRASLFIYCFSTNLKFRSIVLNFFLRKPDNQHNK